MTDKYRTMHPVFKNSFESYVGVPIDFQEALWMYMAYGIEPGGFGMAVLCNDFLSGMVRAHSSWSTQGLRNLAKWIFNEAPFKSYGSNDIVRKWIALDDHTRRDIMIDKGLRPSVIDILRGVAVA